MNRPRPVTASKETTPGAKAAGPPPPVVDLTKPGNREHSANTLASGSSVVSQLSYGGVLFPAFCIKAKGRGTVRRFKSKTREKISVG